MAGARLPRGIPAASLKHSRVSRPWSLLHTSSAGNTRGLIEARSRGSCHPALPGLPRGIPAASLKQDQGFPVAIHAEGRLPRGIPAASLKHCGRHGGCGGWARLPRGIPAASLKPGLGRHQVRAGNESSAGNTRGLIEASRRSASRSRARRLPRGIPAASLKRSEHRRRGPDAPVFRGEYPRPH